MTSQCTATSALITVLRVFADAPPEGLSAKHTKPPGVSGPTFRNWVLGALAGEYIEVADTRPPKTGGSPVNHYRPTFLGLQALRDDAAAQRRRETLAPKDDFVPQIVQPARVNIMALPVYVPPKTYHRNQQPPRKQVWCRGQQTRYTA